MSLLVIPPQTEMNDCPRIRVLYSFVRYMYTVQCMYSVYTWKQTIGKRKRQGSDTNFFINPGSSASIASCTLMLGYISYPRYKGHLKGFLVLVTKRVSRLVDLFTLISGPPHPGYKHSYTIEPMKTHPPPPPTLPSKHKLPRHHSRFKYHLVTLSL